MRYAVAPAVLLLLAACGGGGTTQPTPPPPPPPPPAPPGPPASVVIQAGDGQQAEPGTVLTVRPAVIVKDASGRPVSGVIVSFAVDSGGGTLAAPSATTGGDGVAAAGSWTLGTAEGRNILLATAGSLAPVRIAATAAIQGGALPPVSIPAGGGSYEVTQNGPLKGFKLEVPAGALAGSLQLTVSYASSASIPKVGPVNPVSPIISLGGAPAEYATAPYTIHIAAEIPADHFPVIAMYDPVTGRLVPLTTISYDAHGVTALTATLNPASVFGASLRAGGTAHAGQGIPGHVVLAVPAVFLAQDYDSGFRPGRDDWEFHTLVTALDFNEDATLGMAATALWYFTQQSPQPALWNRFQDAPGVEYSNRRGIRWAGIVHHNSTTTVAQSTLKAIQAIGTSGPGVFYATIFASIKANFAVSRATPQSPPEPQLVALTDGGILGATPRFAAVVAYKTVGTKIYIASPYAPGGNGEYLDFPPSGMVPYTVPASKYFTGFTAYSAVPSSLVDFVDPKVIAQAYANVPGGTVGNGLFPDYELYSKYGKLTSPVYVQDTLRVWAQCPCTFPVLASASAPEATKSLMGIRPFSLTGGAWQVSLGSFANQLDGPLDGFKVIRYNWQAAVGPRSDPVGLIAQKAINAQGGGLDFGYVDWIPFTIVKVKATIGPSPLTQVVSEPLAFTASTAPSLPAHVTYQWDFGDKTQRVDVNDNPTTQHTYTAAGTYPVKLQIVETATSQPIAVATATATISGASVQFDLAGAWDPLQTPTNGSYAFADGQGVRIPSQSNGWDMVSFIYDFAPGGTNGVIFALFVPPGSALAVNQTFSKIGSGIPASPGVFQVLMHQNLSHPDGSLQWVIGNTGSLKLDTLDQLPDGTFVARYSFSVSNGIGGTLVGSGLATWK